MSLEGTDQYLPDIHAAPLLLLYRSHGSLPDKFYLVLSAVLEGCSFLVEVYILFYILHS